MTPSNIGRRDPRPAVTDHRILDLMRNGQAPRDGWTIDTLHAAVGDVSRQQIHRSMKNLRATGDVVVAETRGRGGAYVYQLTNANGQGAGQGAGDRQRVNGADVRAVGEGTKVEPGAQWTVIGMRLEGGATVVQVSDGSGRVTELTIN